MMLQRRLRGLVPALLAAFVSLHFPSAFAQQPKQPKWTHAFDLAVRKFGEAEFTASTQKFGVEVFKDTNTGYGIYISQVGSLCVAPGFENITGAIKASKGPE